MGGFFGLPGPLAELPVTTVLMLRSNATVTQSQGEDHADPEELLACLQGSLWPGPWRRRREVRSSNSHKSKLATKAPSTLAKPPESQTL